jgi:DNA polymerase delta subunit 3
MPDATEPVEESKSIGQPPPKQPDLKEETTFQGGRRRGKRQVMKKKVVKDSEGYLGMGFFSHFSNYTGMIQLTFDAQ